MELNKENVEFLQSACNPIAVSRTFAEWVKAEFNKTGSMTEVRQNLLLKGVLGKLCSMFEIEHNGEQAYAYLSKAKRKLIMSQLVNRDVFALHRERVYQKYSYHIECKWCGRVNMTQSGRMYLYQYWIERDDRNGKRSEIPHLFCSESCRKSYFDIPE